MTTPASGSMVTVLNPDGSVDWWKLTDQWRKVLTDPPISSLAPLTHSHTTHGDINFVGSIQVDGYGGIDDRVVIGTKRLTFKNGICILAEDI